MAIAFVQQTTKFTASGLTAVTSSAFGSSTTSGNFLGITCATWAGGAHTVTASDNKSNTYGTAGAADVSVIDSDGSARASIFGAKNITGGAGHTVTITSTATNSTYFEGNAAEFSGIDTTAPLDQTASTAQGPGVTSNTVTTGSTAQADELVLGCCEVNSGGTFTISDPPTNFNSLGFNGNGSATIGYEGCYRIVSSAGAQSCTWTFTAPASGAAAALATYKAAGGGAAATSLVIPSRRNFGALLNH